MKQNLLFQKSFQELANLLKRFDILEEVIFFGSLIKGNPNPRDIDGILVVRDVNYEKVWSAADIVENFFNKPFNYEILKMETFFDFWRNYRISSEIFVSGYLLFRKMFFSEIFGMIGGYVLSLEKIDKNKKTLFEYYFKRNEIRYKIKLGSKRYFFSPDGYYFITNLLDYLEIKEFKIHPATLSKFAFSNKFKKNL